MFFQFAKNGHAYKVDAWGFATRSEREGGTEEPLQLRPKERLVLSVLVRSGEPVTEDALWRRVWQDEDEAAGEDERRERIRKQIGGLRRALGSHDIVRVRNWTYAIDAEVHRINQYHPPSDPHRREQRADATAAKIMNALFSRRSEATGEADHAGEAALYAAMHASRRIAALTDELEQRRHRADERSSTGPSSVLVSLPASVIHGNGSEPVEIALHEIVAIRGDAEPKVLGYSSSEGPFTIEEMYLFVPRDRVSIDSFLEWAGVDPFHGIGFSSDDKSDALMINDGTGVPQVIVAKLPDAMRLNLTPADRGHPISIRHGRDEQDRSLPWQFSFEEYVYRASDDGSLINRHAGDGRAEEIRLPPILRQLLILLLKTVGRRLFVLSGVEIVSRIWPGREYDGSAKALVREHVKRLNRKLHEGASRDGSPIAAGFQSGSYVLQSEVTYVAGPLHQSSDASSLPYPVTMTIPSVCSVVKTPDGFRENFEMHEVRAIRNDGQPMVLGYAHDFEIDSIMHLFHQTEIGPEKLLEWAGVVEPSRTKLLKDTDNGVWFCAEETEEAGERGVLRMVLVSSFNAILEWDRDDAPIPFRDLHRFFSVPDREPG